MSQMLLRQSTNDGATWTTPNPPGQNILGGEIPEMRWVHGDDLCNCTFQRIGEWTNPYMARTLRVRFCCIWAELYRQFPQFVQEIPAYWDENTEEYVAKPAPWNLEDADMPQHLWHRQAAVESGRPLAQVRQLLRNQTPPQRVPGTGVRSKPCS